MTADLALGARVLFTRTLSRSVRYDSTNRWHVKRWDPHPVPYALGPAAKPDNGRLAGFVIGRRSLSNGHAIWGGYEDPAQWVHVTSVDAYLVAWHLRRKPVLVAPGDLVPLAVQDAVNATLARPEVQDALLVDVAQVRRELETRLERLEDVDLRWSAPGASRALARRARDKADGIRLALRLLGGAS